MFEVKKLKRRCTKLVGDNVQNSIPGYPGTYHKVFTILKIDNTNQYPGLVRLVPVVAVVVFQLWKTLYDLYGRPCWYYNS